MRLGPAASPDSLVAHPLIVAASPIVWVSRPELPEQLRKAGHESRDQVRRLACCMSALLLLLPVGADRILSHQLRRYEGPINKTSWKLAQGLGAGPVIELAPMAAGHPRR